MTPEEVKQVVQTTLQEMKKEHLLKNTSNAIYSDVSEQLINYYKNECQDQKIKTALKDLQDDIYINIIPLYFKDGYTIEAIADMLNVDVSTIVRNKKRICLNIYLLLQ